MGWGRRSAAWATDDKLFMAGAAGVSQREYYKVPQ
jgi:hypothetical protein